MRNKCAFCGNTIKKNENYYKISIEFVPASKQQKKDKKSNKSRSSAEVDLIHVDCLFDYLENYSEMIE